MGDNKKARIFLQKLIEMKYNDPNIFMGMSKILLQENDTAAALKFIEQGRDIFNDNYALIKEQVKLYSLLGKSEELLKQLSEDIDYDPENSILYLIRGSLYEKQKSFDEAEKDYLKTIELNPDYFIANYNLGALYYNQGVIISNAAKDILDNKVYAKEKEKADAKFKVAIPYLEAAYKIDKKDIATMQSLKILYARTGDTEKFNVMKEKLEKATE